MWLLIAIGIILLILLAVAVFIKKKTNKPTDYYTLFIIGLIWTISGAFYLFIPVIKMNFFFIIGLVFMIIGLANRKKWKQNKKNWKNLKIEEKRTKLMIIIGLAVLVIFGLVFFLLI